MKILTESRAVTAKKEGKWMYYSICPFGYESALVFLNSIISKSINASEDEENKNIVPNKTVTLQLM